MSKPMKLFSILMLFISATSFALVLDDKGQMSATPVSQVISISSEADIQNAIKQASLQHLPIAIMGKRYSQGGQTLSLRAIELDMQSFNRVLEIDVAKKQVTVQSGISWSELQKAVNPYNLAVSSMQSPNLFTVGGSMSVNAHGDDFRAGAVGACVVSFHIILANGKKLFVSQETEPVLWQAVRGGYGLLGVVTDVKLQLTDNHLLESNYQESGLEHFPIYFQNNLLNKKEISLFYAHLNIAPGKDFLNKMYIITYSNTYKLPPNVIALDNPDKWNVLLTPLFNLSRKGSSGKALRWALEKQLFSQFYNHRIVTRNNAMEKPVRFASDYHSAKDVDWLQEYFIPVAKLPQFIHRLRSIMLKNSVNLLNVTIRYVPAEEDILLAYSPKNSFAVVLYFNQDLAKDEIERTKVWTRQLIDAALAVEGTYYLPYQPFAAKTQFREAYPRYKEFIKIKEAYDPQNLFISKFYQRYFRIQ
ncbi:putative decaprenylphosphoryl-beta-D-ribose oxidase [Legionella massiliensis]|uniref:Putative decaprenylphosphoryl-beta-D-ribose oxidase n=1 Tax=Legionella massiliensis TaxID=1034943 RepID=A0A078KXJ5_9GAMM|nr:FAD-binding oxidoreductase [Legionella massiliensis]CDZ77762.1 putative decaprenylphosphoryl-beta-D-ribose oxidase [Legionella massiliensis]CEE13500.1 putative decaprenylphosphoryl-beta-D-ribose oxidase [Legionella massiliensis]